MKTKPKHTTEKLDLTPQRNGVALLPANLLARLSACSISSRAVHPDGRLFSSEDRITPRSISSRLTLFLGGDAQLVSRLAAFVLLQVGGRALIGPSRNFGGASGHVILPAGVTVEVR